MATTVAPAGRLAAQVIDQLHDTAQTEIARLADERASLLDDLAGARAENDQLRTAIDRLLAAQPEPAPVKPRTKRKTVNPNVAHMLKAKFPGTLPTERRAHERAQLARWEEAMIATHGRLYGPVRAERRVRRDYATGEEETVSYHPEPEAPGGGLQYRPTTVRGPLLVHGTTEIHDEGAACKYAKALRR